MYASASETSLHTSLRRSSVAVRILAAMAPNARIWVAVVFMVDTPSKVGMVRDLDQIAVTAQGRDRDHASDADDGNEHGALPGADIGGGPVPVFLSTVTLV